MKLNLKQILPIAGLMSIFLFTSAFADNGQQKSTMQQSKSGQGTYQRGTYREITPEAGPRVTRGAEVFITADFIWWKTVQEGSSYATSGFQNFARTNRDAPRGKVAEVGEDWSPGFKIGLGYHLPHDGWDLYAEYTWLHAEDHNTLSVAHDDANSIQFHIEPTTDLPGFDFLPTSAHAHWHLHFNVIDLELGRNFYLSEFLTMRPFIGLKGTWQEQDYRIRFRLVDNLITEEGPYRVFNHNDLWGIGVRNGFKTSWYMAKNWSLYGELAWTTMWTDYNDIRRKDTLTDFDDNTTIDQFNTHYDHHYSVKYIGELELGARW
ncbi:MAG: hypothetical protein K1060chlam2_01081, partial [Chlamydiae bacterium]|nr:hypothetical protein [Chlamydiota bacterium]